MRNSVSRVAVAAALLASSQTAFAASVRETGEEIVVTASRSGNGLPREQLGSSVTVLQPLDLELRQVRVISDVLRDVPGVSVNRSGSVGGLTDIRIRGAENDHTLVLIDGMEVSDPAFGAFDFAALIADDVGRIEVLRGQQSALYGSEAIGGVINYLTVSGAEAPGVRGRVEGGSFGSFGGAARIAGASGGFDYALSAGYQATDGVPTARFGTRDIGAENGVVSARFVQEVTGNFRLRALGRYSYTRADVNDQDFDFFSPTYGYVIDSNDTYRNEALYGLVSAELDLLRGAWTHAVTLQGADSERRSFSGGTPDNGDNGGRIKASYVTAYHFGSDRVRHILTGAVDWEREAFQNVGRFLSQAQAARHTNENTGFIAQYDLLIGDDIGLGAAVRHDDNQRFADATTWRIQGSYAFGFGMRLHAAGGSGVKNPNQYEIFGFDPSNFESNPDLKPERSEGWEAGIEQSLFDGDVRLDATYFDNRLTNEISTDFSDYPISRPINLDTDSTQRGVEVSLTALLDDGWRVLASYTYLDAVEDGQEEVRRPPHIASLNLSYVDPDDRFSATLTVRYNGRMLDNNFTNSGPFRVKMPAFTLVNLDGDVRLTDDIRLYARIENLFDETYEEVYTYATAGRGAFVGLRTGF